MPSWGYLKLLSSFHNEWVLSMTFNTQNHLHLGESQSWQKFLGYSKVFQVIRITKSGLFFSFFLLPPLFFLISIPNGLIITLLLQMQSCSFMGACQQTHQSLSICELIDVCIMHHWDVDFDGNWLMKLSIKRIGSRKAMWILEKQGFNLLSLSTKVINLSLSVNPLSGKWEVCYEPEVSLNGQIKQP